MINIRRCENCHRIRRLYQSGLCFACTTKFQEQLLSARLAGKSCYENFAEMLGGSCSVKDAVMNKRMLVQNMEFIANLYKKGYIEIAPNLYESIIVQKQYLSDSNSILAFIYRNEVAYCLEMSMRPGSDASRVGFTYKARDLIEEAEKELSDCAGYENVFDGLDTGRLYG